MEVVTNETGDSLDELLDRPLYCFLAQCADAGPRVSPLWFDWADEAVWIIAQLSGRSYPERVRRDPRTALAVVDFRPRNGYTRHVGMRGTTSLEPFDDERADRLLETYLGPNREAWDDRFRDLSPDDYQFIRVDPETVVIRGWTHETGLA